jgi:hypothetical protein
MMMGIAKIAGNIALIRIPVINDIGPFNIDPG